MGSALSCPYVILWKLYIILWLSLCVPLLRRKTQLCCGGCSNCSELFLDVSSWRCDLSPMGVFSCVAVISTSCFSVRLGEGSKIGIWVFGSVCCLSTYPSFPFRDIWCCLGFSGVCNTLKEFVLQVVYKTGWKPWHKHVSLFWNWLIGQNFLILVWEILLFLFQKMDKAVPCKGGCRILFSWYPQKLNLIWTIRASPQTSYWIQYKGSSVRFWGSS